MLEYFLTNLSSLLDLLTAITPGLSVRGLVSLLPVCGQILSSGIYLKTKEVIKPVSPKPTQISH